MSPHIESITQVKPSRYISNWTNLLHLTLGGNAEEYGDRTPAIFFHLKEGMMVASAVSGEKNFRAQSVGNEEFWKLPKPGEWTRIEIGQRQEETNAGMTAPALPLAVPSVKSPPTPTSAPSSPPSLLFSQPALCLHPQKT